MARITLSREFLGTRVWMHRLRDARIFHGWVRHIDDMHIDVSIQANSVIEIGDRFRFELHGRKTSAVFEADLSSMEPSDVFSNGLQYLIEGSNAKFVEADWVNLRFQVSGQFRYSTVHEPFRTKLVDTNVAFRMGSRIVEALSIDAAKEGLAALTVENMQTGSTVFFEATTVHGRVTGLAIVRSCRKVNAYHFRVGVQIIEMSRLDRPRWNRVVYET